MILDLQEKQKDLDLDSKFQANTNKIMELIKDLDTSPPLGAKEAEGPSADLELTPDQLQQLKEISSIPQISQEDIDRWNNAAENCNQFQQNLTDLEDQIGTKFVKLRTELNDLEAN